MHSYKKLFFLLLLLLASCGNQQTIVNNLQERDANEIVVFLASKDIPAVKIATQETGVGAGPSITLYGIAVDPENSVTAMSLLNQNGLPRQQGTNLLDLFAKQGLMTTEREEQIRYQVGLAQQVANMIRRIDGILDADVQLSFPEATSALTTPGAPATQARTTAAVYVKHQGILDDPNSHLISKIKRLVSGSVTGLDLNDVTVISDRARFATIQLGEKPQMLTPAAKEYVSIWSIIMSKQSAAKFRTIFFMLTAICSLLLLFVVLLLWKIYPYLRDKGGLKELFRLAPPQPPQADVEEENK